jgi:hypothetical protein
MGVGMGREWTQSEQARWEPSSGNPTGEHNVYTQSVVLRGMGEDREYQVLLDTIKQEQGSGAMRAYALRTPLALPVSFPPRVFTANVDRHGVCYACWHKKI